MREPVHDDFQSYSHFEKSTLIDDYFTTATNKTPSRKSRAAFQDDDRMDSARYFFRKASRSPNAARFREYTRTRHENQ
ncbi:MAG: hypothetical protein DKINENOH_01457 [bacterium]|nr:hypothetical protein [bacterium]